MRLVPLILVLALGLHAQQPREDNAELLSTIERLRSAIAAEDWKHAAELSKTLSNSVSGSRDSVLSRSSSGEIENFIEALPENTETLAVAQRSFKLSDLGGNVQLDALQVARGYVLGLLGAAEKGQVFKSLQGSTLRYAVLVARKFRNHPPDGSQALPLGMIDYQGCAVYAVAGAVSEMVFPKVPETTIFGKRVWLMQGKQYEQARDATPKFDTYLFTLLKADTILACNDRDFLESIVQGLASPTGKHGLPSNLPEWTHVDRPSPFWGLRHFKTGASEADPTDPNQGALLGTIYEGSIGITFQVESPAGQIQGRWLSTSPGNPWEPFTKAPDVGPAAATRRLADGTWDLSVKDELGPGYFTVFALMGMLGFVVLL